MTDEDDWKDGSGAVLTECGTCGEQKLCVLISDPYFDELYPDDVNDESWWCGKCYQQRKDDI